MGEKDAKQFTVAQLIEALASLPPDAPVEIVDADTGWIMPLSRVYFEHYNGVNGGVQNDIPRKFVPGTVLLEAQYEDYFAREHRGVDALTPEQIAQIKESRDLQRQLERLVADWVVDHPEAVHNRDRAALKTFEKQMQAIFLVPELKAEYVQRGVTLSLPDTRYVFDGPIGASVFATAHGRTGK